MNWEAFLETYWVYIPLATVIILLVAIYKKYLRGYRYRRMLESVHRQKRVNLSPWTNWRLLIMTLVIVSISIGLLWSGFSTYEVLLYSFGMLFLYYLLEIVYRKIRAERVGLVEKLAGLMILFILILVAYYQGYNIPKGELEKSVIDLTFKVSNDSYMGAPVIAGDAETPVMATIALVTPDGVTHTIDTVSDATNRNGGDGEGFSSYIFDLTPYLEKNIVGETVTVRWLYESGDNCAHMTDLAIVINKVHGVYAPGYHDKVVSSCATDKDESKWQEAVITVK